ncbi:MAG: prepilin peptidase [Caulobacter sp.]|nr:prepilin peptidase [Caulobacter sp.]
MVLGPVAGSFIGLLSLRLPAGRPVAVGRSACDHCGRKLGPVDLVPVISFLALRGRCRSCGGAIPRRYLAIELGCLAIGVWAAFAFDGPMALITALFGWQLLLIAIVDAEHFWLPDRLTLPLGAMGLGFAWLLSRIYPGFSPLNALIGVAAGFASLGLVAWAYRQLRSREGLGGGDPRLFAAIGAWVGWMGLPSVLVWAGIAGASVIAATMVNRKKVADDQRMPFGAFLAAGAWLTWIFGPLGGSPLIP